MTFPVSLDVESQRTLQRLIPRLEASLAGQITADPTAWQVFNARLTQHFPVLFRLFYDLYSHRYDFFFHIEELLFSLARAWFDRPLDLKALDNAREAHPQWYLSNQMLGGVFYVDCFAGDLEGVRKKIPYFQELGLTYLHLMPLFQMPEGENDGGYAVSSYREVHPPLGTMAMLSSLAQDLRQAGISLVLDLVFNHTSNEHAWAQKAQAGDPEYRELYHFFPDRSMPDSYERTLREIFPDEHPGAFTPLYLENERTENSSQPEAWVWTTFHHYQWDLNYTNPQVFVRMLEEMLFLANQGVEVLRLDAVAFTWKQLGTSCENLPQAHTLIQAFNAAARIAAPALLFKSEAIVHPDEVAKYISPQECQLSYNPLLMALLWNSLATRKVRLLKQALSTRFLIDPACAWVNYVRCHDDIGWTFSDEDAMRLGINPYDHRQFLNEFYTGRFKGSFARGLPFQENVKTGDRRISGSCASLAGLEKALHEEGAAEVELAIRRILLLHGMILVVGGIPLIYLGDEIGQLNDYRYRSDPLKMNDSRWVHRPAMDWENHTHRQDPTTLEGRIYLPLQRLISIRKTTPAFSGGSLQVMELGHEHVLGFVRENNQQRVLVFANFSDHKQVMEANYLRLYGLGCQAFLDLISGENVTSNDWEMEPYQFACLIPSDEELN